MQRTTSIQKIHGEITQNDGTGSGGIPRSRKHSTGTTEALSNQKCNSAVLLLLLQSPVVLLISIRTCYARRRRPSRCPRTQQNIQEVRRFRPYLHDTFAAAGM